MKPSKRQVFFISLIFVLKCISKSILFRTKVSFKDFLRQSNRSWAARAFQNRTNHVWRSGYSGGVGRREGKEAQGGAASRLWGCSSNVTEQSLRDISAFLRFYNKRRLTIFFFWGGGAGVGIYHAQTSKSKFLRTNLAKSSENKFVLC